MIYTSFSTGIYRTMKEVLCFNKFPFPLSEKFKQKSPMPPVGGLGKLRKSLLNGTANMSGNADELQFKYKLG